MTHTTSIPVLIVFSLLFASCSATLPIDYAPSNLIVGTGTVSVHRFSYTAARNGQVAPTQLEKNPSGIGDVYLFEEIETLFTDAVRKELRFSGYKWADNAPTSISGTIDRFYYDWVGFTTQRVELVVTFGVEKDGKGIFSKQIISQKEAPKSPGYEMEAIKSSISDCIQRFLQEAQGKGAI